MEIVCADGAVLKATPFIAQGIAKGVVVLAGATGVRRNVYTPFAEHLASQGWQVFTFDARGIAASTMQHSRKEAACMRDWGRLDLDAVLRCAADQWGGWEGVILVGHSSGGHLAGLAPALKNVPRMLLVASGTCNWRLYPRRQWPRLLVTWYLAVPALVALYGYLPAWAGVGMDLPKGVARDWRNWSVAPDYLFSDSSLDVSGYFSYSGQVHAISMADDLGYSPPATVKDLLRHFSSAQVSHEELKPSQGQGRLGHFGFFSARHSNRWETVTNWLHLPVSGIKTS